MSRTIKETNALIISILEDHNTTEFKNKGNVLKDARKAIKYMTHWCIIFESIPSNRCILSIDLEYSFTTNSVPSLSTRVGVIGIWRDLVDSYEVAKLLTHVNDLGHKIQIDFNE